MAGGPLHPWLWLDPERARSVISRFIAEYVGRAGAKGVTLGLSGGLDSGLVAALAMEALGAARVDAVYLAGPTSSPEDGVAALELADHLGLRLAQVPIAPVAESLERALGGEASRSTRGNLQARLRMAVLYARAQAHGRIVAGTGNKSELLTGYFTKHGDGAVDMLPIGDLYKTQVRAVAARVKLPERVLLRAPTAGLWEGQTDEGELGITYAKLDVVLAGIEMQRDEATTAKEAGVPATEVRRVADMVRRTWHKRNPPPVPKLGWRTVGVDWREPTS